MDTEQLYEAVEDLSGMVLEYTTDRQLSPSEACAVIQVVAANVNLAAAWSRIRKAVDDAL